MRSATTPVQSIVVLGALVGAVLGKADNDAKGVLGGLGKQPGITVRQDESALANFNCVQDPGSGWHIEPACIYRDCTFNHNLGNGKQCSTAWTACFGCVVEGMWTHACYGDTQYTTEDPPVCIVRGQGCCRTPGCGPRC